MRSSAASAPAHTPSILLIDDDVLSTELRATILRARYPLVSCACSAADGLELATSREFGIILIDFDMPETNGMDLALTLKARHVESILIMLSGHIAPPPGADNLFAFYICKGQGIKQIFSVLDKVADSFRRVRKP